jgi:SPP1 family predicted phage head-tail adaptor
MRILNEIHKIARLDREIEIWRITETRTGTGGVSKTNTSLGTFWAMVDYGGRSGGQQEVEYAGKLTEIQSVSFVIRYYEGITPKDFITYEGATYDIKEIVEEGRRRFHRIFAQKRV